MQLTIRQKEIVKQLLNSSTPIITQTLADNEHVSVRTIKYDLKRIREWLGYRSNELISRPHAGIWFQIDANEAQRLRQEVDTVAQIDDGYLRPSDRMQLLLLILLQEPGYITIQQLQTRINVSHTTLKNDLRKIGQYLSQFHVSLVNKTITALS
ncbi:HTH domain-containing protein [Lacticaseibacillus saniviri]|uniref:HTH domain-containing protein n=1 Tax=Lacticaseibacillus saniviri TaxID=931533 RepID=UPI0009EB38E2|nr:HTH domain-containing protein [Lacticaseibacillus saniviri]